MGTIRIFHNDSLFTSETATKDQDDLVGAEELGHLREMGEPGLETERYRPGVERL